MKRLQTLVALALVALMPSRFSAQSGEQPSTMFGNASFETGLFLSPSLGAMNLESSSVLFLNVRGGVILEDRFSFGPFFQTSLNEIRLEGELTPNSYLDYWVVGGFAELTALSKKIVHITFPFFIGYGEVELDGERQELAYGESNFVQFEPSALVELNLHPNLRFNAGVGYRFLGSMTYRNLTSADFDGFTGFVGLKVGLFKT